MNMKSQMKHSTVVSFFEHSLIPVHWSLDLTRTSPFYRATLNRNTKEVSWHIPSIEVHAISYSISMELKVLNSVIVVMRSSFLQGQQGNLRRLNC